MRNADCAGQSEPGNRDEGVTRTLRAVGSKQNRRGENSARRRQESGHCQGQKGAGKTGVFRLKHGNVGLGTPGVLNQRQRIFSCSPVLFRAESVPQNSLVKATRGGPPGLLRLSQSIDWPTKEHKMNILDSLAKTKARLHEGSALTVDIEAAKRCPPSPHSTNSGLRRGNFLSAPEIRLACRAIAFGSRKRRLVPGVGVEPTEQNGKQAEPGPVARKSEVDNPRSSPRCSGQAGDDVAGVVLAWAKLSESVRAAILALVDAGRGGQP